MIRAAVLAALLPGVLAGCDSRAKASDTEGGRADQKSHEFESCAASMQCAEDLRCFDQVCRKVSRSTIGDYYAALGSMNRTKGDLEAAITAFHESVARYDEAKIGQPAEIDCAYGAALAADKGNKEHAELGARILHRCIAAVPPGSSLRDRALADLATLNDVGFEPATLNNTKAADLYLTRQPARPGADKVAVTVTASPLPAAATYHAIPDRLTAADLHGPLVACWDSYAKATNKDTLVVAFGLKVGVADSGFDDEPGQFFAKLDPPAAGAPGPEAAAEGCVRAVVEPALKSLTTIRDQFATRLTITMK